jgi:hypothetical protein
MLSSEPSLAIDAICMGLLGKKCSEILVEEASARIKAFAILLEPFQALAKGLVDLLPCELACLIKQWGAAMLTAELIIGLQKLLPTGMPCGDWISGHDWTVVLIGEQ